jgi:ribosomal protein S18 acetylase RimI-like enzyme
MHHVQIDIRTDDRPELEAFLGDRLYEFNSRTTGIFDGELLNASVEDAAGNIVAAMSGHTWGGCCEISRLWVHESRRGTGLGIALMQAAEREAVRRGCHQIVLSTHSFQAPRFYEKLGFQRLAAIPNYPQGYEDIIYIKYLPGASAT